MAKLILEIISFSGKARDLRVFDGSVVRIGRGYGNDLILQDSYVSAQHAVVSLVADGQIEIVDADSENGIQLLPSGKKIAKVALLESGATIMVGHTKIRVLLPDHPIVPTQILNEQDNMNPSISRLSHWYALMGFITIYFFHIATHYPFVPLLVSQIIFWEFILILGMCIWAGAWAIFGRLIRHQSRFIVHFTWICFFMIAMVPIINMCGYLGFIFAEPAVEGLTLIVLAGSACAALIFQQLTLATALGRREKIISAIAVPATLLTISFIGSFAFRNEFSSEPKYYTRVKPPYLAPVFVSSPDQFIAHTDKVFKKLKETSFDYKD
ncbi:MAG: FHA domain-containing protein [Candidatus Omnitrophica bacterium]|nr:FHA domain-containing protein [Candidatus Omnitrophota bacterium]